MNRYLVGAFVQAGHFSPEAEAPVSVEEDMETPIPRESVTGDDTASPTALPTRRLLPSELEGVDDEAWTTWVLAMKVAEPTDVADSGALGMFAIKPRRLADLGLMKNVSHSNPRKTGQLQWSGEWADPRLTRDVFLSSPTIQYRAFVASTRFYATGIEDGSISCPDVLADDGVTLSGALALLHKCGPRALEQWSNVKSRKPGTIELFGVTNGLF